MPCPYSGRNHFQSNSWNSIKIKNLKNRKREEIEGIICRPEKQLRVGLSNGHAISTRRRHQAAISASGLHLQQYEALIIRKQSEMEEGIVYRTNSKTEVT
jgi:hypothetical protein